MWWLLSNLLGKNKLFDSSLKHKACPKGGGEGKKGWKDVREV
jgi:hypothetical protein